VANTPQPEIGWMEICSAIPIRFIYQDQVRFFIADFYCHSARLVIELDGKIHEHQKEYDEFQTYLINQLGMQVLRIKNEELKDIAAVSAKINAFCNNSTVLSALVNRD
jgi:very-short-patch-repair endonuclease